MSSYPTVHLTRKDIDNAIRAEVAKRAGVLRSDVGKIRYKIKTRGVSVGRDARYLEGAVVSHS